MTETKMWNNIDLHDVGDYKVITTSGSTYLLTIVGEGTEGNVLTRYQETAVPSTEKQGFASIKLYHDEKPLNIISIPVCGLGESAIFVLSDNDKVLTTMVTTPVVVIEQV